MKHLSRAFSVYLFLIGISAIYGGWAIIYTDSMQFPPDLLQTTPFDSFILPGIILTVVYGGIQLVAAYLLWTGYKFRYEAAAVAGFCQLIWMFTEVFLIPEHHWVQILYFGFAIVTFVTLLVLLKYVPEK